MAVEGEKKIAFAQKQLLLESVELIEKLFKSIFNFDSQTACEKLPLETQEQQPLRATINDTFGHISNKIALGSVLLWHDHIWMDFWDLFWVTEFSSSPSAYRVYHFCHHLSHSPSTRCSFTLWMHKFYVMETFDTSITLERGKLCIGNVLSCLDLLNTT